MIKGRNKFMKKIIGFLLVGVLAFLGCSDDDNWSSKSNGKIMPVTPGEATNIIAAGYSYSLGIRADGTVVAWGRKDYGECNVPAGLTDVVAVAAGLDHSLALKSDGTVVAWGDNRYGECNVPAGLDLTLIFKLPDS